MDVNTSPEVRDKVIAWANSKNKSLEEGLELLEATGYKPHVCQNFIKNKARRDIPAKLEYELKLYLRYHANPTAEIHADEELEAEKVFQSNIEKELANEEYSPIVKQLLTIYSQSYNDRSIAHRELKAVGESNDDESNEKRKSLLQSIEAMSLRQDALWAAFESYKTDGVEPSEELLTAEFTPVDAPEADKPENEFKLAEGLVALKKQSDNWRTKISKAGNRLNFQSEKKEDKPNPMPEGPKRISLLKKIEQLKSEKEQIDLAIANAK